MSKLNNKYSIQSIHKMIVDSLTEDGVICNYNNKTYDELGTYEGGIGHRKAFNNYNNKIIKYHQILSTLIGEKRADIRETIPVIDYLNVENTSLANTYLTTNDKNNPIDSTVIVNTEFNDSKSALDLIKEDDKSIINRAILGYNVAEHFYNTCSQSASCYNIQTSTFINNYEYLYKGIYLPVTNLTNEDSKDIRKTPLLCYKTSTSGKLIFNPDNTDSEYKHSIASKTSSNEYILYDKHGAMILNTDCGRTTGPSGESLSFKKHVDSVGAEIITHYDSETLATLNVAPNDIVMVIPTTVYSSTPNKIIYLRAAEQSETTTTEAFLGTYNSDSNIFILRASEYSSTNPDNYYVDVNTNKVYQYNTQSTSYVELEKVTVKNYSEQDIKTTIEFEGITYSYTKYVIYIENYDSEFSAQFVLQEVEYNTEVPTFLRNKEIIEHLSDYINIECEYYSDASGLLNGYFCEPCEWEGDGSSRIVTKWKLVNDKDRANEYGVDIDAGSQYNPSHILYRGDMYTSPMKLTESDKVIEYDEEGNPQIITGIDNLHAHGYYGKASVYYNRLLENESIFTDMFKSVQLSNENWYSINSSLYNVDSFVNKFDYTDFKLNSIDAVSLSGKLNPYSDGGISKMKYKKKFIKNNEILDTDDIINYINLYHDSIQGSTLVLNANHENTIATHATYQRKRKWINKKTRLISEMQNMMDSLEESPMVSYYVTYDRVLKKNGNIEDPFRDPDVYAITPFELFLKDNESVQTILLYPEYADKFPETMFIISRNKLSLEEYNEQQTNNNKGMCFLYSDGKFIMSTVSSVLDCRLSKLNRLMVTDETGTHACSFNFGTSNDCWVYELAPISLSFDKIDLYDSNNVLIPDTDLELNSTIIGASYPEDYFKISKVYTADSISYSLLSSNRQSDINNLSKSSIITGLPTFNSLIQLSKYKSTLNGELREFLNSFYNMIYDSTKRDDSALRTITKRIFTSLVYDWKLSDSSINPILLKDVSGITSNLKDFTLNISNLIDESEFKVVIDNEYVTLTKDHFASLLARIGDNSEYSFYSYDVSANTEISLDDLFESCSYSEEIKDTYKFYKKVDSKYIPFIPSEEPGVQCYKRKYLKYTLSDNATYKDDDKNTYYNKINPEGSDYNPANFSEVTGLVRGTDISIYYVNRELNLATNDLLRQRLNISKIKDLNKQRLTYEHIENTMNRVFADGALSKEDCRDIDSCFGDNTEPMLVFGETMAYQNIPTSLKNKISEIFNVVTTITKNISQNVVNIDHSDDKLEYVLFIKNEYKKYYNADSVELAVDENGDVDDSLLKLDFSKETVKSKLQNIKNNAGIIYLILGLANPLLLLLSLNWLALSVDTFIEKYQLNLNDEDITLTLLNKTRRTLILKALLKLINDDISKNIKNHTNKWIISEDKVQNYYIENSNQFINTVTFNIEPSSDNKKFNIYVNCPNINNNGELVKGKNSLEDCKIKDVDTIYNNVVISEDVLKGIAEFIKTSLEGTDPDGQYGYYVKYVSGDDEVTGRKNGLYYKRYNILNTRMNMIQGPLYKAASYIKNTKIFDDIQKISSQTLATYDKFLTVMPVAEMEGMTYLEPQKATNTTIELAGKYYSDKELDALRNQINSACVLTCTRCNIKDSCPFYSEEEVIKLYCTGLETIDLWLKDNELELLDTDSLELKLNGSGTGFDTSKFNTIHKPYSDIVKKIINGKELDYDVNDLNSVRNMLQSQTEDTAVNLNYNKYVQDDMGWLLGGRYGTVEKNILKTMDSDEYSNVKDNIYDYKYLYNALFINIEDKDSTKNSKIPVAENDSYINYTTSSHSYDISFESGPAGNKKTYSGTTKIKIPCGIKLLNNCNDQDDIYLVSDDVKDSEGLDIVPIIYLGKARTLQFTFDLTDDGVPHGVISPEDTKLYAADVAQWCANYYKGCLAEDPIGNSGDTNKDKDQYWMDKVYKKINGTWYPFDGRKRVQSGYQEAVASVDNFDEIAVISGHPVVNSYVDFVRKVSIRMYDPSIEDEYHRWLVPFVNENMPLPWKDKTFEQNVEIQRKVLTLMKTNLRLVLVKNKTSD